jgi:DNA-binding PadR family transcriptional regulator
MRAGKGHVRCHIAMELTGLEREFLERLAGGPWASPPLFDHSLIARLVDDGLVQTETLPGGSVQYEITEAGRAEIEQP